MKFAMGEYVSAYSRTRRVNSPDSLCYICGSYTQKRLKITEFVQKA